MSFNKTILCALLGLSISGVAHSMNTLPRVAPLTPHFVEVLNELNKGDSPKFQIVTTTKNSPEIARYSDDLKTPIEIGNYRSFSVEKILSSKPDIILASDHNPKHLLQKLSSLDLQVHKFSSKNIEDVLKSIREIGAVLKVENQATNLVSKIETNLNNLQEKVEKKERKNVFLALGHEPLYTVGSKGFLVDLLDLVKAQNIFSSSRFEYLKPGIEDILKKNPEVILVLKFKDLNEAKIKKFWGAYPQIDAVKKNQIYFLDADLIGRPGPYLDQAAKSLAQKVHQEVF